MPITWDSRIRPHRPNRSTRKRTAAKRLRNDLLQSHGRHVAKPTHQTLSAEGVARGEFFRAWQEFHRAGG